jgi:hypothetical protein
MEKFSTSGTGINKASPKRTRDVQSRPFKSQQNGNADKRQEDNTRRRMLVIGLTGMLLVGMGFPRAVVLGDWESGSSSVGFALALEGERGIGTRVGVNSLARPGHADNILY